MFVTPPAEAVPDEPRDAVALPVAFEAYDGSRCGSGDPPATLIVRSPNALRRILTAPGQLGLGRAFVAGDRAQEARVDELAALQSGVPDARWQTAENLHVTLCFCDEVQGAVMRDLEEELSERSVGFRIEDEDLEDLKTVRDAVDYVFDKVNKP